MENREDSPLINFKKRKKRGKKRKYTDIDDNNNNSNNSNKPRKKRKKNKKRKLNNNKLTQSVCCPICIANISILSEFEADGHIQKCFAIYQEMKKKHNENISSLHQQRRENKIKHNLVVNEWRNILNTNNNNNHNNKKTNKNEKELIKERGVPAFKKLKGTNIVINTFNYDHIDNINNANSVHFLTHFRCDYYIGITSEWNKPIYCSSITAKLLHHMFNINENIINPLPMNKQILIPNSNPLTFVTLMASNNFINGSVNLLFQITNNRNNQYNHDNHNKIVRINGYKNLSMHNWLIPYKYDHDDDDGNNDIIYNDLYCSDFHININNKNEYDGIKIRNLYLDTTYFHKKYKFVAEIELFKNIENIIDGFIKKYDGQKICFMFGITFIERMNLLIYLSKKFKRKIYVNKTKKSLLCLLELRDELNQCFSTKNDGQEFETIAVKNINFKNLNMISNNNDNYDMIVGFKLIEPNGSTSNIRKTTKNNVTLVNVPYSDHCNFEELVDFVKGINPLKIIPTANLKESTKYIAKYF